jgi:REP element-mobilizing transposase RayT
MARPPRLDIPGQTYHITQHGVDDRRIFVDDIDRELFLRFLSEEVGRSDWTCLAYCLMGTHYHVLVRPNDSTLSSGFQRLNLRYAISYNRRYERRGHLFEARFRDKLVDDLFHHAEAMRYIHLNPVRAGICDQPEQHQWSDYGSTVGLYIGDFIVDTRTALEPFGSDLKKARATYQQFVREPDRRVRRGQVREWLRHGTYQAPAS